MMVVIIPAYCPDEALFKITEELWIKGYQPIVVDDGSGIEYEDIFHKVSDVAVVLHHQDNMGKGAAIKTALCYIWDEMEDCTAIGIMDCDGQHRTEDMQHVLECAENHPDSLVLGVRAVGKKMPFRSLVGNWVTRNVFRMVSGVRVSDTQTGLRAFQRDRIPQLLRIPGERYEYEMNVLVEFAKAKIPIREIPIDTIYHDRKNSCSHFHVIRDSFRIYRDMLKFTLSSLSSFVVDYILFVLFTMLFPKAAAGVFLANVMARIISAFYNYSTNCRFVFHTKKNIGTAMEYFALAVFILFMNSVVLEIYTQILHIPVYPAKILTECTLFVISFFVQKKMIFRPRLCPAGGKAE